MSLSKIKPEIHGLLQHLVNPWAWNTSPMTRLGKVVQSYKLIIANSLTSINLQRFQAKLRCHKKSHIDFSASSGVTKQVAQGSSRQKLPKEKSLLIVLACFGSRSLAIPKPLCQPADALRVFFLLKVHASLNFANPWSFYFFLNREWSKDVWNLLCKQASIYQSALSPQKIVAHSTRPASEAWSRKDLRKDLQTKASFHCTACCEPWTVLRPLNAMFYVFWGTEESKVWCKENRS